MLFRRCSVCMPKRVPKVPKPKQKPQRVFSFGLECLC